MLPPYVRGPSPFDSMDLSLQSSRSSSSPLNKAMAAAHGMPAMHEYVGQSHKQSAALAAAAAAAAQQQQQQAQHQQQQQMHGNASGYPM